MPSSTLSRLLRITVGFAVIALTTTLGFAATAAAPDVDRLNSDQLTELLIILEVELESQQASSPGAPYKPSDLAAILAGIRQRLAELQ